MRISFSQLCQAILIKNAELALTEEYEMREAKLRRRYDDVQLRLKGEYQAKLGDVGSAKQALWDAVRMEFGEDINSDCYGIDLDTGDVVLDSEINPPYDEDEKLHG